MAGHVFVDETKAKGYLVAAALLEGDLEAYRKPLRALVLPRQRALHMKDESDPRRRAIADTIARLTRIGVGVTVYDAGSRYANGLERRGRCLAALVKDAARLTSVSITFDLDESLATWDRQQMIELTRKAQVGDRLSYSHSSRYGEPLLAIPDAVAWCWARGGDWRRRVQPVIRAVRQV